MNDISRRPPELGLDPDSATASTLHGRAIFLLASPATGAERLLAALGCFPSVAAAPVPTHMFSVGIHRILEHWWIENGPQALSGLTTNQEFLLNVRLLADEPLAAYRASSGAERVVEYSADHPAHADEIAGLYPDGHLIHVVRDGRQVATRLASPMWGWAPRYAAKRWIDDQKSILEAEDHPLLVVRIEDLVREPREVLAALAPHLDLEAPPDVLERAAEAVGAARHLPEIPPGRAAAIVEIVGSDLLRRYDYDGRRAPAAQWAGGWGEMMASGSVGVGRRIGAEVKPHVTKAARTAARALRRHG